MAYIQGQTNVKNVLADFITTVCLDDMAVEKFENWTLLCPLIKQPGELIPNGQEDYVVFSEKEAYDWIIKKRRATIGSTFMPPNEWQYNEVFKVTQEYLDNFSNEIFIEEEIKFTKQELEEHNGIIKFSLGRRVIEPENAECYIDEILNTTTTPEEPIMFIYDNDYNALSLLEFYIDIKNKELCLLSDNFVLNTNENFTLHIKYKTSLTFEIPILKTIYDISAIKLRIKGHKGVFYNNTELESLDIMEFYPDIKNKKLILLKDTIDLNDDYEVIFLTSYQTYATNPISWYVEFTYPTHINSDNLNYNYFEWVFGNTINWENYQVQSNKGKKSPIFRCFWHTINKLKAPSADWLPIEYFISWDETAISFVFCEDPITDLNAVMHAFNYIGVLESIEDADYDDINSNFGSCGSYDITAQVPGGIINDMSLIRNKANITFLEKIYDSYFENSEEHILLKLNNVAYGNYTVGTDIVNHANLLSQETLQYIMGDSTNPYSSPAPVSSTFNGQPIGRYNILKKGTVADFILPINTKLVDPLDTTGALLTLAEDARATIMTGSPVIIPHYSASIFIANPTITVTNTTTSLPENLSAGEAITLYTDISTVFILGSTFSIPSNTLFIASNGQQYKTISTMEIFTNTIGFNVNTLFTLQENEKVYVPDDETYVREETILAGTTLKLIDTYIETKYDSAEEYIIEFQYRDPYKGSMHYDFPTKWFDGTIKPKSPTDFSGSTPLLTPIVAERMLSNSPFENEDTIEDTISSSFKGKDPVLNRLSYTKSNNNDYHKNTIYVPKIITNSQTGEEWTLNSVQTINGIEKTENSITNICMYPRQVYVGNFYYTKRSGKKCTITLGEHDVDRMRFVLTDNTNKVLVDFDGSHTYQNLKIARNNDNGLTIEIDTKNLYSETVYLKVYKKNNYLTSDSGFILNSITKPGGCGGVFVDHLDGTCCSTHFNSCGYFINATFKTETFPIDVKLYFNYENYDEFVTHLISTKHQWGSSISTSSWTFPSAPVCPIHANARLIGAPEVYAMAVSKGMGIDPNADFYSSIFIKNEDLNKNAIVNNNYLSVLAIQLNNEDNPFIPLVISGPNIAHNWV